MPVREATPGDVPEIAAMVREHAAHEGGADRCHLDEEKGGAALFSAAATLRALIAYPGGEPEVAAGCMLWFPTFSSWAATRGAWVEDLYVRPQYRRAGLGRELLSVLRSMTPGRIEWDVHVANEAARAFYAHLGAEPLLEWTTFRWLP